ncbi:MAG TPA: XdhC family protein [Longimicrobiales bacterium]|nr:XdhC family protein [Longimicrobiales bacterium]
MRPELEAAARAALAAYDGGDAVALVTLVAAEPPGRLEPGARMLLAGASGPVGSLGAPELDAAALELARAALAGAEPGSRAVDAGGARCTLFVEAHFPPEELIVVGAGHIAVPLAALGTTLGFRVTVLDDREDFATPERFPSAARVLRADFAEPFRDVTLGPRSYVVLVTRGHRHDFDFLTRLLDSDAAPRYIGMIGSRRRVRAAFHALAEAGATPERLARVHAPIGVDIGAETPAEIAVSIAAELVAVRRGVQVETLAGKERVVERWGPRPGPPL